MPKQERRGASVRQAIGDILRNRIMVIDGAMGTAIQELDLNQEAFGGEAFEGCNEILVRTSPNHIRQIHRQHLEAGADIIETNSFGGTPLVLAEFQLEAEALQLNRLASKIAREEADKFQTADKPRFVAGSMGPTTKAISVTGGVHFEELVATFYVQAKGLWEGGADFLILETCQDTRNVKAGLLAIGQLSSELGEDIPVAVSGTIEAMGTMLAGQSVEALLASVAHADLLYLGLNCATGPEFMTEHLRALSQICPFPVACVPNAGLPDENGNYLETPEMMTTVLENFVEEGWLNLVGGCCGTRPAHVKRFVEMVRGKKPRNDRGSVVSRLSGIDYLEVTEEIRPVIVGERTNVIGSRNFKKLICDEKFDEASEIARAQVKGGAQIIDLCLANPDRDEKSDVEKFYAELIKKVRVPLMIDSTDAEVIEKALTFCQGKSLINSINLEEGESRFEEVVPLAKKFGAALVVGTIDDDPDQGMGVSVERKVEIARRSYTLLTQKYDFPPEDIYWDPLVFPCGTGDENYVGSAKFTIEGIRKIKETFPRTKTVLGISNVSFGLPNAGREVLNSVFLFECVQAGLDLAIVNSQKLVRYSTISIEDREACLDLLLNRRADAIARFTDRFRERREKREVSKKLPLDERLANYILEGTKQGLIEDLKLKLQECKPMKIINGPLMAGMDEVGRLFNQNQLIVAEVLQSAEVMKAAVAFLEPFLEKAENSSRGKILLATVKGDVHDIGKNLVEIILANNGFEVVNLGIKVSSDKLIQAIEEHQPDIVGLSGLLVKSAQQMVATAGDFNRAGIRTPIMVGGAALSPAFVDRKISKAYDKGTVTYAPDAMQGLDLAKVIVDPAKFEKLKAELLDRRSKLVDDNDEKGNVPRKVITDRCPDIGIESNIPQPQDFERHVLSRVPIAQIWQYLNPMMVYGRHLGVNGQTVRRLTAALDNPKALQKVRTDDPKGFSIWEAVEEVKASYVNRPELRPTGVYQFFRAFSRGNDLVLLNDQKQEQQVFTFPRREPKPTLCIADYVHPDPNAGDSVGLFAVTVGRGVREEAERLKEAGEYLKSHIVQVLALESAEAYAEYMHSQIRRMWGFPDSTQMTMLERFQAKYRGRRYSFGYPACPQLADQEKFFDVLKPQDIGVELTDGFMMDPEASVSALVFHHSQASYFSVGRIGQDD